MRPLGADGECCARLAGMVEVITYRSAAVWRARPAASSALLPASARAMADAALASWHGVNSRARVADPWPTLAMAIRGERNAMLAHRPPHAGQQRSSIDPPRWPHAGEHQDLWGVRRRAG
jgi:hypothetical protein